ncbi:hypothetical protein BpHYR1_053171 [Brachionus plicatilis]|uniref:Uncharacterized protein n=1 Tax=Brachionus plicatilis TaxID=10195 RepID=A0A3M7QMX0_BRAPC|nr:hypothetical protein BpHYR1_053171 [Brachionus plicatilis]
MNISTVSSLSVEHVKFFKQLLGNQDNKTKKQFLSEEIFDSFSKGKKIMMSFFCTKIVNRLSMSNFQTVARQPRQQDEEAIFEKFDEILKFEVR